MSREPSAEEDPLRVARSVGVHRLESMPAQPGTPRVSVIGVCVVDVSLRAVDELPTTQVSLPVDEIVLTAAGTAAGTAMGLAKLGSEVALYGAIGSDLLGELLVSVVRRRGIGTAGLQRHASLPTGATVLPIRPDGTRPAWRQEGAFPAWDPSGLTESSLVDADAIFIGGADVVPGLRSVEFVDLIRRRRDHGSLVVLDLLRRDEPRTLERIAPLLRTADWILPNDDQLRALTGVSDLEDGVDLLLDHGVRGVAVTLGAEGSFAKTAEGRTYRAAALPVEVVDTTGCGDAFDSAFVTALLRGNDVADALALGSAAGSLTATGLGSDAGFADPQELFAALGDRDPGLARRVAFDAASREAVA